MIQVLSILMSLSVQVSAMCGCFVAQIVNSSAKLANRSNQVILARDGDRIAMSMANDYRGELKEFALLVPVPVVLKREQIHVGNSDIFDRLARVTAPRIVETSFGGDAFGPGAALQSVRESAQSHSTLGVTVEARFSVGEYDIVILGARDSEGLEVWLKGNGYHLPQGAAKALQPYVRQKMKFFVAKVNLKEQSKTGFTGLRPIQFAYEDPRFMLPIRLGMLNADGPQELTVYLLSRKGRVETTNYRTVKIPASSAFSRAGRGTVFFPASIKSDFPRFYEAVFSTALKREGGRVVFNEFSADARLSAPEEKGLTAEELRRAGVSWSTEPGSGVWLTKLRLRYDAEHFPEDLVFQETTDEETFVPAYHIAGSGLSREMAEAVANLTGWNVETIPYYRQPPPPPPPPPYWKEVIWFWSEVWVKGISRSLGREP